MQNSQHSTPVSPQLACDRETFQRVWRRVMPEDRPDCPFTLLEPQSVPQSEEAVPSGPIRVETPPAPSVPVPPSAPAECPMEDGSLLMDEEPVSLGRSAAIHVPQLQEMILHELSDWRFYQQLSRRTSGLFARALSSMAGDERRHAKRLSAAAFLISGVRFLPNDQKPASLPSSLPGALRAAFSNEQHSESAYRAAAAETTDEALRELWMELSEEESTHAQLIRNLLEQL